ncbi:MAG TPA: 4-demethylwyosine synthase TYW1 [Methanocella sp.]|uniref:4-demethylwyosine synthase TYW1 n=1 Tax=Methanocella sp. TaxID=2052833 RepID=UPI002B9BA091|nr:4-demethylwyosine synthase TYW1 [Methanocella sp.]HTY89744.1 4-demethylwyosine synthase TYW1 [Methanocella sp.]
MSLVELLKKQGYHIIGEHSAIKPCLWLGRSLKGQGACYKSHFYGIQSHLCMQMTPCIACNQRCLHCWRPVEEPFTVKSWDRPETIVDGCLKEQKRFISGYGGIQETDLRRWKDAFEPRHAAISLVGEPTLYPHLKELVALLSEKGMSTFIVTNGTRPDVLDKVTPSQLYMSLDAPDRETYLTACNPVADLWDKVNESLEVLGQRDSRRALRLTLIKGVNMKDPEGYAALIKKASPDYVEVKAYMHLGYSRNRLPREAMPKHEEVLSFARQVADAAQYKLALDVELSRVALVSKDGAVKPLI